MPLAVETLERIQQDGYTREKIIFNPDAFSSIPAYVLIPDSASPDNPAPAVLCAHGHGIGKDGAVGIVEDYQKQFAVELAQRGFVTIAPDWRCFGERLDRDEWVRRPGQGWMQRRLFRTWIFRLSTSTTQHFRWATMFGHISSHVLKWMGVGWDVWDVRLVAR